MKFYIMVGMAYESIIINIIRVTNTRTAEKLNPLESQF